MKHPDISNLAVDFPLSSALLRIQAFTLDTGFRDHNVDDISIHAMNLFHRGILKTAILLFRKRAVNPMVPNVF